MAANFNWARSFIVAAMQVAFTLEILQVSVLSRPSGAAASNSALVRLSPAA